MVRDNLMLQQYVTEKYARVWRLSTASIANNKPLARSSIVRMEDEVNEVLQQGEYAGFENEETKSSSPPSSSSSSSSRTLFKRYELLKDLIIEHGSDPLGATVALGQLLKSSENIIQRLVNKELMFRFKNLGKYNIYIHIYYIILSK
jgi:hypothetical protein